MNCNHDCRDASECRTREACELGEYAVRVIRPGVAPLRYTTRAPSSGDALMQAGDRHGWDAKISTRRAGA